MEKKQRIKKTIRNATISIVVLLVLMIGGGIAYTWYIGRQTVVIAPVETTTPVNTTIKHVEAAPNVPEGVSIQTLTTPVAPGSNASVIIKTNPASTCTIVVEYNKVASKDSGLNPKVSDEFGSLTWAWTVEETVPVGKWPVTITCTRGPKYTAVVIGDLVVAK